MVLTSLIHRILMEKLSTQYNLHWSLLRWVASFLQGRAQVTHVGASVSAPLYLNGGIPQGTKLGPVLFAVMVNDLVQSWGACIKFVDGLTVLEVVPRNSPSLLNVVVDDIHAFAVNNNMRLNPRKCKSTTVDFLHYNSCVPRQVEVGVSDIEQVSTFKLLGVHLSEDLTWAVHCDYIVKKANRRLYALRQLKKCKVPSADIVHIYCALIRSILEYASAVFAGLPKYLACYIKNVQKRALSIIWPGISYETALDKAALSTLSDRRAVSCIKFIGKVRPGNPLYPLIHNRVVPISTSVCLRSGSSSRPMATRTERFSNFVSVKYQSCQ